MFYYTVINEFGLVVKNEGFYTEEDRNEVVASLEYDEYYEIWVGQEGQPAKRIQ
jgi:hypothetical protein